MPPDSAGCASASRDTRSCGCLKPLKCLPKKVAKKREKTVEKTRKSRENSGLAEQRVGNNSSQRAYCFIARFDENSTFFPLIRSGAVSGVQDTHAMVISLLSAREALERVDPQSAIRSQIRSGLGLPSHLQVEWFEKPLLTVADYLGGLPLSRSACPEPYGALKFALSWSFLAWQSAIQRTFASNEPAHVRRMREGQYRYGAWLSALIAGAVQPHLELEASVGDVVWDVFSVPIGLQAFCRAHQAAEYVPRWRASARKPDKALMAFAASRLVPLGIVAQLSTAVAEEFVASLAPTSASADVENNLLRAVREAHSKVLQFEQATRNRVYQPVTQQPAEAPNPNLLLQGTPQQPATASDDDAGELWSKVPPELQEWATLVCAKLKALQSDQMPAGLKWSKKGLAIPIKFAGGFGLSSGEIVGLLERCKGLAAKEGSSMVVTRWFGTRLWENTA
jgi:hypothetical protein